MANDGNPLVIALCCLLGALFVILVGGFAYNSTMGKKGIQAVPFYESIKASMSKGSSIPENSGYSKAS